MGKPEGKRRLGRQRRKWEDTIRIDLHDCVRGRMRTGFWCGNLREREDLEDIVVNGGIILDLHDCGRGTMHTGFWWGNLREIEDLLDIGINGRIILE